MHRFFETASLAILALPLMFHQAAALEFHLRDLPNVKYLAVLAEVKGNDVLILRNSEKCEAFPLVCEFMTEREKARAILTHGPGPHISTDAVPEAADCIATLYASPDAVEATIQFLEAHPSDSAAVKRAKSLRGDVSRPNCLEKVPDGWSDANEE